MGTTDSTTASAVSVPRPGGSAIGLWLSISLSINYLWAESVVIIYLLMLRRSLKGKGDILLCIAIGVIAGWSNEAFAVPVCAATFIAGAAKRFSGYGRQTKVLVLSLWVATVPLMLSPGTLRRALTGNDVESTAEFAARTADCFTSISLVYVLIAACAVLALTSRVAAKRFIYSNRFMLLLLTVTFTFALYAHSYAHSLAFIEIISLILLLRIAGTTCGTLYCRWPHAAIFTTAILAAYLTCATYVNCKVTDNFDRMSQLFATSSDGLTCMVHPKYPRILSPLVSKNIIPITPDHYSAVPYAVINGRRDALPLIVGPEDYRTLTSGEQIGTLCKQVKGNAGAYEGFDFYYIPIHPSDTVPVGITGIYEGDDFIKTKPMLKRIIYHIKGNRKTPVRLKFATVTLASGRYIVIHKPHTAPSRIDRTDSRSTARH